MSVKNNIKKRYQTFNIAQDFSDEEMVRDWTLSFADMVELNNYRKNFRAFIALQLCSIKLFGRFINNTSSISIRIINYLNTQLNLPPSLNIDVPEREATLSEQRKNILEYLGFTKYDQNAESRLIVWLRESVKQGNLPSNLFQKAEQYLLDAKIILPGPTVLERLIISICSDSHQDLFDTLFNKMSEKIKSKLDKILETIPELRISQFQILKEFPPSATISSIQTYLWRYKLLTEIDIDSLAVKFEQPFIDYFYKLAYRYDAYDETIK